MSMLSRVADNLFWMSRYIERAEAVARLVDVGFHLELDLAGLLPDDYQPPWVAILTVLQQEIPEFVAYNTNPTGAVGEWLSFELENPVSILACVNRARNNIRGIRGQVSSEMWRSLNTLYWRLRDPDFVAVARQAPNEYFAAVQAGSQQFQGVCDATLSHDEGWQFIQIGKLLERADKTIRLLDVKYRQLQQLTDPSDLPLATLEWAGLLKSCAAYEAYQRLYISRVEPETVVEFLLLNDVSPRSVRFCFEASAAALERIDVGRRGDVPAERALGRVISDLKYAELPQLLAGDFHAFLAGLLQRCSAASAAIQEQYSLAT